MKLLEFEGDTCLSAP